MRCSSRSEFTEHVLLALLEQEAGDGVLSGLGVTKAEVEAVVATLLAGATAGAENDDPGRS